MADTLKLRVVTPERALVDEDVDELQVPGLDGYMGFLPGHAPLFSQLEIGELSYVRGGAKKSIALARGFVEISNDCVRVLAEVAETAADIDVERAAAARSRAEERISNGGEDTDYATLQDDLKRADVRLGVAKRK